MDVDLGAIENAEIVPNSPKTSEGGFSEPPTDPEYTDAEHQDDEGSDNEKEVNEIISNPSKDIKQDLKRILEKDPLTSPMGTFSSSRLYADAPNPSLNVEGLGVIGFPLSEATAKYLISGCTQAPFGKGERTIVDKLVRDTWEIDAPKVTFRNPAWTEWVKNKVIPDVCEVLGVGLAATNPKVELYKLLVYQTGSHFLSHQDTEKSPGMFATMVIILPSKFTGGSLHLSHAGESRVLDTAAHSEFGTHVASWYTDVFHSINAVESGYRVALSYNLIHTSTPSLRPDLMGMNAHEQELRHVLLSWSQTNYPQRVLYLLDHMYSESNLRASMLKGKDHHRVTLLRSVAEKLHFRLCLVSLELHESGGANDHGGYTYNEVEMVEVNESNLSISRAYDLNGRKFELQEDLDLEEADCIPYALSKTEPDDQDYEGYQGNYGGKMDLWYSRTALLIWPKKFDSDIALHYYMLYAREHLRVPKSKQATRKEKKVLAELIQWLREDARGDDLTEAVEIVTNATLHWKDIDKWIDTCKAARIDFDLQGLDVAIIIDGVKVLGFDGIKSFLDDIMKHNKSDKHRLNILSCLGAIAEDEKMVHWVKEWESLTLRALRGLESGIATHLVEAIARSEQSSDALQDIIMPQIKKLRPFTEFLIAFAQGLKSKNLISTEEAQELLSNAISVAEPFPKVPARKGETATADLDRWMKTFQLAANTDVGLIKIFCNRMEASWKSQNANQKTWLRKEFFPGAMVSQESWAQSTTPPIIPGDNLVLPFWTMALKCYLQHIHEDLHSFMFALRWCGGLDTTKDMVRPALETFCRDAPMAAQALADRINTLTKTDNPTYKPLLEMIVLTLATHSPLGEAGDGSPDIKTLSSLLEAVITHGNDNSAHQFLNRLIQYKPNAGSAHDYIFSCLLPFIHNLITKLGTRWPLASFSEFVASSLVTAVKVLGLDAKSSISASDLNSLGCGCAKCQALPVFAMDDREHLDFKAAQPDRTHIERQLKGKAEKWGFTWETITDRTPYTLRITKAPALVNQRRWPTNRNTVVTALNSVGPLSLQKDILGSTWPDVCKILMLDPSVAETNPTGFHTVWTESSAPISASITRSSRTYTSKILAAMVSSTSLPVQSQDADTGLGRIGVAGPSTILPRTAVPSRPAAQAAKRPFEQAMGNAGGPVPKRSKPAKPSLEIIELSD